MEKVSVWFTDAWKKGLQVRLNAGEAIDAGDGYGTPQGVLHYEGNLDEILQHTSTVYRFNAGHLCRHFYFSGQEALAAAEAAGLVNQKEGGIEKGHIKPAKYKPVSLPALAILEENDRGLFCRMNLHPEIFGTKKLGKIYFPARACVDSLCPGPVMISGVKERTSYGFFFGQTAHFSLPSDKVLSEYIIEHGLLKSTVLLCSNKFGEFALVGEKCLACHNDTTYFGNFPLDMYDRIFTVEKTLLGAELISRDVPWG